MERKEERGTSAIVIDENLLLSQSKVSCSVVRVGNAVLGNAIDRRVPNVLSFTYICLSFSFCTRLYTSGSACFRVFRASGKMASWGLGGGCVSVDTSPEAGKEIGGKTKQSTRVGDRHATARSRSLDPGELRHLFPKQQYVVPSSGVPTYHCCVRLFVSSRGQGKSDAAGIWGSPKVAKVGSRKISSDFSSPTFWPRQGSTPPASICRRITAVRDARARTQGRCVGGLLVSGERRSERRV